MSPAQLLFAVMWVAASVDGALTKTALSEWNAARSKGPGAPRLPPDYMSSCPWMRWETFARGGGEYVLTPIGEDVVATARLIGQHAQPVAPVKVCAACGGTREVCIINTFSVPCTECRAEICDAFIIDANPYEIQWLRPRIPGFSWRSAPSYLSDSPGSLGGDGQ